MSRAAVAAVLAAVIGLAACGSQAPTPRPTVTVHATSSASALPAMSRAQDRQECAALDMIRLGFGTYAREVQVMAGQYTVPRHVAAAMIARTVRDACPAEVSVLP